MKIEYTLTDKDYINLTRSFAETSSTIKKSMLRSRIAGLIMFLLLPFVLEDTGDVPFAFWIIMFSIPAIAWFFLMPIFAGKKTVRRVRKMLKEKGNSFLGHKTLELGEDGILTTGHDGESLTSYNAVEDVTQYKGGVYIYTSSISAIMISPEAFESEAHKQEFLDKLYSKVEIKEKTPAKKSIFDKLDNL